MNQQDRVTNRALVKTWRHTAVAQLAKRYLLFLAKSLYN